ncbi:shikimate dehydrogenase [Streptomyces sp. WMMB 322]|uniref:shikimate dehydrogenase n=1 Tax=Streptomyces sp. WMMB 322 TaxID=1286821 RepID=UPI0006E3C9A1|nr:shikimate dehydrogenase [Streptomyces sp. WMMB 322]SCK44001.1 shikimate dehydrogenase [Streptomyces sp. WMMB 322]
MDRHHPVRPAPAASPSVRRAAVLGSPVAHSLSPVLHSAAYAELGLEDWTYERYEVGEEDIASFLGATDEQWAGLSLTMPLKRAVIPHLDDVSPTAESVEAVNTVVFRGRRRIGDNTDIPGMVAALQERGIMGVEHAAVLGAGATASSALAALSQICDGVVTAYVRSDARAREMRAWGDRLGLNLRTAEWADAAEALGAPLVIATTPAGATDVLSAHVPAEPGTLFDVLYDPWPTRLAAQWSAQGGTVVSGLDLLVHQAVLQVELMTGHAPAPLEAMRAAGEAALHARTV